MKNIYFHFIDKQADLVKWLGQSHTHEVTVLVFEPVLHMNPSSLQLYFIAYINHLFKVM